MKGILVLLPILCVTWGLGLLAVESETITTESETIIFAYLFTAFNSLQGVFIFLVYFVFDYEVRRYIMTHFETQNLTSGSCVLKLSSFLNLHRMSGVCIDN